MRRGFLADGACYEEHVRVTDGEKKAGVVFGEGVRAERRKRRRGVRKKNQSGACEKIPKKGALVTASEGSATSNMQKEKRGI